MAVSVPVDRSTWDFTNFAKDLSEESKLEMDSSWAAIRLLKIGESSTQPFKSRAGIANKVKRAVWLHEVVAHHFEIF
jgi:hypothetical protein